MGTPAEHAPQGQGGQGYQPPPIIINNSASAAASATAVGGWAGRRKHSLWAHFWLLLFTAGIGNVLYWLHVRNWNRKRGL